MILTRCFIFSILLIIFQAPVVMGVDQISSNTSELNQNLRINPALELKLDSLIDSLRITNNLPGIAVGIWIPGDHNYLKTFGKANLETGEERLFNDPFRIASITKTFTATIILSLVDDGLIKTSDKLSLYLPDFPNAENISIRNLLRMRSGITDYADSTILQDWFENPFKYYSLDTLIGIMESKGEQFNQPGIHTVYCNGNYTILAKIAEIVSGKSFNELLEQRIFQPLGMESTVYPDPDYHFLNGLNRGYSWVDEHFQDVTGMNTSCANAGGAIISNMHDLEIYARALYQGTLLSPETHQHRMESETFWGAPDFIQYGEGIIKFGEFYGHNGTIFGFSSEMYYLPPEDAVIIINVNRLDLDDVTQSSTIFRKVSSLVFPEYVDW